MQTAKRILLVEDDPDDQQFFSEALTRIHPSINCKIAKDGEEALARIESPPPYEIVFLDLNMPKIDGFECLKRLKAHDKYKEIPVVIVSTTSRAEDMKRCKELGAASFLTKPNSLEMLFHELNGILSNPILA